MTIPKLVLKRNNFYYVVLERHSVDSKVVMCLKMTMGEYTYLTMTGKVKKSVKRFPNIRKLLIHFIFNCLNINTINEIGNIVKKDKDIVLLGYDSRFLLFKNNKIDEIVEYKDKMIIRVGGEEIKYQLASTRIKIEVKDKDDVELTLLCPRKHFINYNN